ncbi:MAG: 2-amino-4-hydroxy-6-hydroxymethyldihydropteridine diphosphokinase [candidate division Zixibacteria bacterium]|nr:2-amino-4-hydroxy-6-hydroxymethyldihydropteridine diphosphokinase [candidate division Zixibacteria bacterium]
MAETTYILLGSNLGDREGFLAAALDRMQSIEGLEIIATSAVYVTEPVDMPPDAPGFLNQVVKADYQYAPRELLHALEQIEYELGRTGKGRCLPRTMDLDILLFGEQVLDSKQLTIPHRKLLRRAFALVPLLQLDANLVHPVTNKPIAKYLSTAEAAEVIVYKDHVARNV